MFRLEHPRGCEFWLQHQVSSWQQTTRSDSYYRRREGHVIICVSLVVAEYLKNLSTDLDGVWLTDRES